LLSECQKSDEGILPGERLKDSIKKVNELGYIVETPRRQDLRAVSTPQIFPTYPIKKAYRKILEKKSEGNLPTDDAEVFTLAGGKVRVVILAHGNPKITTLEDWKRLVGEPLF
jgi:2-C-methyl-D-erythritol 4-phosphate cytidylyltransferase